MFPDIVVVIVAVGSLGNATSNKRRSWFRFTALQRRRRYIPIQIRSILLFHLPGVVRIHKVSFADLGYFVSTNCKVLSDFDCLLLEWIFTIE